jgi:Cu/Ag efflux protein CusF
VRSTGSAEGDRTGCANFIEGVIRKMFGTAIGVSATRKRTGILAGLIGLSLIGGTHAGDDLLDPDDAFRLAVGQKDKQTLVAQFDIAKDYCLYKAVHVAQAEPGKAVTGLKADGAARGAARLPLADGEIEDVDIPNHYLILKHGPIANLNMDAMTMAFTVNALAMLTKVKVGDKVRFTAKNVADVPTIMSLEVQK